MPTSDFPIMSQGLLQGAAKLVSPEILGALKQASAAVGQVMNELHSELARVSASPRLTATGKREAALEHLSDATEKLARLEVGTDFAGWAQHAEQLRQQLTPAPLPGNDVVSELRAQETRRYLLENVTDLERDAAYLSACEAGNDPITVAAFENCSQTIQRALVSDLSVIAKGQARRAETGNPTLFAKFKMVSTAARTFADLVAAGRGEIQKLVQQNGGTPAGSEPFVLGRTGTAA